MTVRKRKMNKRMNTGFSVILFGLLVGIAAIRPANSAPIITDLGEFTPREVANDGMVIGFGFVSSEIRALTYVGGVTQDVSPSASYAAGFAANNDGIVGSYFDTSAGQFRAFIKSAGGGFTFLDAPGGWSEPYRASGKYVSGSSGNGAFRYSESDGFQNIDTGSASSMGLGVNSFGDVVGQRQVGASYEAYIADGGNFGITPLGGLGGSESIAFAINDAGYIVGSAVSSVTNTKHAVAWTNGVVFDYGVTSELYDVNNLGRAVGYYSDKAGNMSAVITGLQPGLVSLADLLSDMGPFSSLNVAQGINDRGDVVGMGRLQNGSYHGFLITGITIPEPTTLHLFIAGLLGYASMMRLNSSKQVKIKLNP